MSTLSLVCYKYLLLFLVLALAVAFTEVAITHLRQFTEYSLLPLAMTIDLTVGIPALYYLFIVRRYRVPLTTVAGVFLLMLYLAGLIIPVEQQFYLHQLRKITLLTEPLLLGIGLFKIRRIVREYRLARSLRADFGQNLATGFQVVFGNPLLPLVSELMMLRYGLLFWLKTPIASSQRAFSMHHESGFVALISTVMMVSVIEMVVVHLLVMRWSQAVALGLLLLGGYSLLFLLAHLRAVQQRPVLLEDTKLVLRAGLIWAGESALTNIESIALLRDPDILQKDVLNLAKPLLTTPNILLVFREPVTLEGLYGLQKRPRSLALYLDQQDDFIAAVRQLQLSPEQ